VSPQSVVAPAWRRALSLPFRCWRRCRAYKRFRPSSGSIKRRARHRVCPSRDAPISPCEFRPSRLSPDVHRGAWRCSVPTEQPPLQAKDVLPGEKTSALRGV
jgi:hypothetical protein